jgi:pimeloyl-ACP methyl ester carboxylesterase
MKKPDSKPLSLATLSMLGQPLSDQMKESTAPTPIEKEFNLNGFRYAAQLWEAPLDSGAEKQPVIALHGWLDNSASFDILAPLLVESCNAQVLAPDLAGHGHSDHRDGFSDYSIWSEVLAILAIANEMEWQVFTLIGHSRGAMIAMMAASLFPDRVSKLVLIDAIAPSPVTASRAPEKMRKSMQEMQRRVLRKTSCYPSYDAAIQARMSSDVTKVNKSTARRLAVRGLSEVEAGFHWHSDGKLWAFSHLSLTLEQIVAFAEELKSKTYILLAKQGFKAFIQENSTYLRLTDELIELLDADVKDFDDGHYLHMESSAVDVANTISDFIKVSSTINII